MQLALEMKLVAVYLAGRMYTQALALIEKMLKQLKRIDDKSSLVEVHLLESRCFLQLKNLPKSRAALTSARTSANAIYCPPTTQLQLDIQSGTLHAEEFDYKTAYSYFYEVAEGANGLTDASNAVLGLKYMMLSKVMMGESADVPAIVNGKVALKYKDSTHDIEAMAAVAEAVKSRSLHTLQSVLNKHPKELQQDMLVNSHINQLYESLLVNHLRRIVEPFSRVQVSHIAKLVGLDAHVVEQKLSIMILDGDLKAVLDQSNGTLVVFEDELFIDKDAAQVLRKKAAVQTTMSKDEKKDEVDSGSVLYESLLDGIKQLNGVVDALYEKSKQL